MFTGALLQSLTRGVPDGAERLSLYEIYEEIRDVLNAQDLGSSRPELHAPGQEDGDISRLPLFPNPAYRPPGANSDEALTTTAPAPKPSAIESLPGRRSRADRARAVTGVLVVLAAVAAVGYAAARVSVREPSDTSSISPAPRVVARRTIAVIDISDDAMVRDVASRLLDLLSSHRELAPPAITDAVALTTRPPRDDVRRIAEAQRKRQSAEQNLALHNFREAAIDAVEGQELLFRVEPRAAITLYADLALALGRSQLAENKDAPAQAAFALTYRLDPRRTLDELRYTWEVVQAFESAKHATPGTGSIRVRGAGRVWIDGEEVGAAPGDFKAPYGRHVVWLTGPLQQTNGKEVTVTQTQAGDASIMDAPLTRPEKVGRLRAALSQAPDPAARASAMAALAAFIDVHDAVLLAIANGKIDYQLWHDHEPGFGAIHELGSRDPSEILRLLLPGPDVHAP